MAGARDAVRFTVCQEPAEAARWDAFLQTCPGTHYEQTVGWAEVRRLYGWTPSWVWAECDGDIVGGSLVLTRRFGPLATVGYVARGPVWSPDHPGSMRTALEAVWRYARSMRLAYLVVLPPYIGADLVPLLHERAFHRKPDRLPPSLATATATLVIDLTQDLDTILARMSMTKRQNVRRGLRKGVIVKTGRPTDPDTFRTLMWQSCQRRGIAPSPPQADFFTNVDRTLGPSGVARFFIAEVEGEAVSGACTFGTSDRLELWRVGWSGKYDTHDPNDVLHWEVIKWAKEHGYREFDFAHVEPAHARALLRGGTISDSYSGVTNFKTAFGGQLRLLPEPYYRAFHPVVHLGLSVGGARLVDSLSTHRFFDRIMRRLSS